MAEDPNATRSMERRAVERFSTGALVGLAGGILALVVPVTLVLLAAYAPSVVLPFGDLAIEAVTAIAAVGALLFVVSLLFYRRALAALRRVDRRFWGPSALCLLGTLGFLLVFLAAILALASTDALTTCLQGSPSRAPSCLLSSSPRAAYSGAAGLVLAWLGGLGIVTGLALAAGRFGEVAWLGGAAAYAILLALLAAPFVAIVVPIRSLTYPILAAPLLVILAPALVASGSRRVAARPGRP